MMFDIKHGDCISIMKTMEDNSIDSIVTDPPYELGFMGKSWDSTGIAFNVEVWQQALRVLKPGGHLLAFSGSRTYHRMAVAIEDAGFEIRDQIMWVYGSGFPKSLDVSKAIDKVAGAEREVIGNYRGVVKGDGGRYNWHDTDSIGPTIVNITKAATPEAQQWQGWGTALKPAHEPIVLARKPLIATVATNVLTWGVGGLNIDDSRVGNEIISTHNAPKGTFAGGEPDRGSDTSTYENHQGRWPANFIHDGSDEVLELFPDAKGKVGMNQQATNRGLYKGGESLGDTKINDGIDDSGSAARFFYCAKTSKRDRNEGLDDANAQQVDKTRKEGSVGGNNPRNRGANERTNYHPTVKPTDLMRYLCKLITPPNGLILDPFMGSGSTGKGALMEDFNFIGIEQDEQYIEIARARIEFVIKERENFLFKDKI